MKPKICLSCSKEFIPTGGRQKRHSDCQKEYKNAYNKEYGKTDKRKEYRKEYRDQGAKKLVKRKKLITLLAIGMTVEEASKKLGMRLTPINN